MTTKLEALAATRTQKHRGIEWTACPPCCPAAGVVEILSGKKSSRYLVAEVYVAPGYGPGRAFRLTKPGGAETYDVFVSQDRTHGTCTCPGFTYDASRKADRRHGTTTATLGCKHADACEALLFNNWLPDPRENPGADAGSTETADQPLPACFRDLPALPVPGCPF